MVSIGVLVDCWHIMLKFLPIILLSSAQNLHLLFPKVYLLFSKKKKKKDGNDSIGRNNEVSLYLLVTL